MTMAGVAAAVPIVHLLHVQRWRPRALAVLHVAGVAMVSAAAAALASAKRPLGKSFGQPRAVLFDRGVPLAAARLE